MSKALIMRMYAGEPREELVALARELYANGRLLDEGGLASQAIGARRRGVRATATSTPPARRRCGRALDATRRGWGG